MECNKMRKDTETNALVEKNDPVEKLLSDIEGSFLTAAGVGSVDVQNVVDTVIAQTKNNADLSDSFKGVLNQRDLKDTLFKKAYDIAKSIGQANMEHSNAAYLQILENPNQANMIASKYVQSMNSLGGSSERFVERNAEKVLNASDAKKIEFLEAKVAVELYSANKNIVRAVSGQLNDSAEINDITAQIKKDNVNAEKRDAAIDIYMNKALEKASPEIKVIVERGQADAYRTYAVDLQNHLRHDLSVGLSAGTTALTKGKDQLYTMVKANSDLGIYQNHTESLGATYKENITAYSQQQDFAKQRKEEMASRSQGTDLRVATIKKNAAKSESAPVSPVTTPTLPRRSSFAVQSWARGSVDNARNSAKTTQSSVNNSPDITKK